MTHALLTPRRLADRYVDAVIALDPMAATILGVTQGAEGFGDLSPVGLEARAELRSRTLAELDGVEAGVPPQGDERRCATLLRERLTAEQTLHEAGEDLRGLSTLFCPLQEIRQVLQLMPADSESDWEVIGRRLGAVPAALEGYRQTLAEGRARGLPVGPTQVRAVIDQLGQWLAARAGAGWFQEFAAGAPPAVRPHLDRPASRANSAVASLREWLRDDYGPFAVEHGRDPVGAERYRLLARGWTGADVDLDEAYAWAWHEYGRIEAQLAVEAEQVLPGSGVRAAMEQLERSGPAVEGVPAVLEYLQGLMDDAIGALDGTHFELAAPLKRVEAMIAPEGSAAAPYYTPPSLDFARPGRTWLPTLGRTRFPTWDLVTTWYHEGVPGHHLQFAQWVLRSGELSRFQTVLGTVSADYEGWALYAERLMDDLGFLCEPAQRLGYLDAQRMRTVRVIIDIGMHLELLIPADQGGAPPFEPGRRWTPALAREFLGRSCGQSPTFLDSELVRYLGGAGQAIGYKLGERAWLAGRTAAEARRRARGEAFDLKAWHMAALSQGSLGLDDLVAELSVL